MWRVFLMWYKLPSLTKMKHFFNVSLYHVLSIVRLSKIFFVFLEYNSNDVDNIRKSQNATIINV